MGKRYREKRAREKLLARTWGVKENEFGELTQKLTKAEARRRLLRREFNCRYTEKEIIDAVVQKAVEDIRAEEDRLWLAEIERAVEACKEDQHECT